MLAEKNVKWSEILQRVRHLKLNKLTYGVEVTQAEILEILEDIAYKELEKSNRKYGTI